MSLKSLRCKILVRNVEAVHEVKFVNYHNCSQPNVFSFDTMTLYCKSAMNKPNRFCLR